VPTIAPASMSALAPFNSFFSNISPPNENRAAAECRMRQRHVQANVDDRAVLRVGLAERSRDGQRFPVRRSTVR
jgi:hypothetical protein